MSGNRISSPVTEIAALFGGQTAMARALGLRQSTVWEWVKNESIPWRHIPAVMEAALNLQPPVELKPDHFFGEAPIPPSSHGEAA